LRSRHSPTSSPWTVERADPPAAEPIDLDPDGVHHPADDVEDALVDRDGQVDAAPVLAQDADLARDDDPVVQPDPGPELVQLAGVRHPERPDVVLLLEAVARVHDPVGDLAIVREDQQTLGVRSSRPTG
jgi:hypothetical protein